MSSYLPEIQKNRPTASITFLTFFLIIGLVSIGKFPDLRDKDVNFGLLFATTFLVIIFSLLGIIEKIEKKISQIEKIDQKWIGKDIKFLIKHIDFKKMIEKPVSEFINGLTFLVISLSFTIPNYRIGFITLIFTKYNTRIWSVTDIVIIIIFLIFTFGIGVYFIKDAIKIGKSSNKNSWNLLFYFRLNQIPQENENNVSNVWIKKIDPYTYIKSNDWDQLDIILRSQIYKQIEMNIEKYKKSLQQLQVDLENEDGNKDGGKLYPYFSLTKSTFDGKFDFDGFSTIEGKGELSFDFRIIFMNNINLIELLYEDEKLYNDVNKLNTLRLNLLAYDFIFTQISRIFLIFYNYQLTDNALRIKYIDYKKWNKPVNIYYTIKYLLQLLNYEFTEGEILKMKIKASSTRIDFVNDIYHIKLNKSVLQNLESFASKEEFQHEITEITTKSNDGDLETLLINYNKIMENLHDITLNNYQFELKYKINYQELLTVIETYTYFNMLKFYSNKRQVIITEIKILSSNILKKLKNSQYIWDLYN